MHQEASSETLTEPTSRGPFFPQSISTRLARQDADRGPLRRSLLRIRTKSPQMGLLMFLHSTMKAEGRICIAEGLCTSTGCIASTRRAGLGVSSDVGRPG